MALSQAVPLGSRGCVWSETQDQWTPAPLKRSGRARRQSPCPGGTQGTGISTTGRNTWLSGTWDSGVAASPPVPPAVIRGRGLRPGRAYWPRPQCLAAPPSLKARGGQAGAARVTTGRCPTRMSQASPRKSTTKVSECVSDCLCECE